MSVTLVDGYGWHAVYLAPSVLAVEIEHGVEAERHAYNAHFMNEAVRQKDVVLGRHAGLADLFVPVIAGGRMEHMLIAGPFRTKPIDSGEVREQWRWLTGQQGHWGDPAFTNYLAGCLAAPRYEGESLEALKRWMRGLAALIGAEQSADELAKELQAADTELTEACFVHRMWHAALELVDSRVSQSWASELMRPRRVEVGMPKMPEQVLVGLVASPFGEVDPVDDLIRRHEFQRACVRLARSRQAASGPVGDNGVTFMLPPERSETRSLAKLVEVAERVAVLGRRQFGLRVHIGVGPVSGTASLPARYHLAFAAAEKALSQGVRLAHAPKSAQRSPNAVRELRAELARLPARSGPKLGVLFERYAEVSTAHSGYRLEPTRARLEAGFDGMADSLLASGAIDRVTLDDLYATLDAKAEAASTLGDLLGVYRHAVADLELAVARPTLAHQERSLERALTFIREHFAEPLQLATVARIAGFEPHYFSRLFKRREGVPFERFVTELRVARARQMLVRTELGVERVGQLSGFRSAHYFHRVFKRITGETPLAYRLGQGWTKTVRATPGRW